MCSERLRSPLVCIPYALMSELVTVSLMSDVGLRQRFVKRGSRHAH